MDHTGGSTLRARAAAYVHRGFRWALPTLACLIAAAPVAARPQAQASGLRAEASFTRQADGVVLPTPLLGFGEPRALTGWVPNDRIGDIPWSSLQWNFAGEWGVDATRAWAQLRAIRGGSSGGAGVKIAVIDSGVAYRTQGVYRATPDLPRSRVLRGYDFVGEDRFPDDESGHGTHVASTIAAQTDNAAGLTGLAYNAEIVPIRVLDASDRGDVVTVARGIRYATKRRVDLINLSVDFPVSTTAGEVPEVMRAIREAYDAGILVVASSGNEGASRVSLPARSSMVLAVGATTARGCRTSYSNGGRDLDLAAPGGGTDHVSERGDPRCRPGEQGPPIAQVTLLRSGEPSSLGVPMDYVGTSMATAHVTAVAALVRASGILGPDPSPDLMAAYLVRSTRDLGVRGRDNRYGTGLIDARRATSKKMNPAPLRGARRAAAGKPPRSSALPVIR